MNPSRRQVLGGGLGLAASYLLTGCGGNGSAHPSPLPSATTTPPPPLSGAGRDAIRNEQELLGAYDAVVARHPSLLDALEVPREHHRAHVTALGDQAAPTASSMTVPTSPRAAVQALIALEQAAVAQRQGAAITDTGYGSLLAAIAGAEAVHVDLLTRTLPRIPIS